MKTSDTLEEFLASYDASKYPQQSNAVDMILMTVENQELKLLLVQRKNHPWKNDWALPGGFVDSKEDIEKAALRELQEETKISKNTYFRQLYTLGNVNRDPRTRVISTVYFSMTPPETIKNTKAGDDAKKAKWFSISKSTIKTDVLRRKTLLTIKNEEEGILMEYDIDDHAKHNYIQTSSKLKKSSNAQLAGDHIKVINMAMDMLQNRAASTGIMFNVLPEEATLKEMQIVYEAIIGHKTDTGNFRRDIRKMLKPTGNYRLVHGKKTALYTYNPMLIYVEENL